MNGKRLLSLALMLTLVLVLTLVPIRAEAATVKSGTCGDNLTWTLDDKGTLTISGTGPMDSYDFGGGPWYDDDSNIEEVIIEDGVTTIGDYAFEDCTSLTSVTIGNSVTTIGNLAFSDCDNLTSVTIPDSVTDIGEYAFSGCDSLTSVTIPGSVTSIGQSAFSLCSCLTRVTIGNGVTTIGEDAFYGCASLTSVTIGNGVRTIGYRVFSGCDSLASVTIPDSVTDIGEYAFSGCDSLASVTIGNSVSEIGNYAFYDCSSLTSVTIGNSVTTIGDFAFAYCFSLTSVTIPATVSSIGDFSFMRCESLTDVYYGGTEKLWKNISIGENNTCLTQASIHYENVTIVAGGECGDNLTWVLDNEGTLTVSGTGAMTNYTGEGDVPWEDYQRSIKSVVMKRGVTSIGGHAFYGCHLTSISIPNTVTDIRGWAFAECPALEEIVIPDSVVTMGGHVFSGSAKLKVVTLSSALSSIPGYTFDGCNSLTAVTIPATVSSIGDSSFKGCVSLTDVYYGGTEKLWKNISIGKDNTCLTQASIHYESGTIVADGTCGKNLTWTLDDKGTLTISGTGAMDYYSSYYFRPSDIPWYEFRDSIKKVNIGNSVTTIGDSAFEGCTSLTSVTIPNSVTDIGWYAFRYCDSLTSVTIPNSVTTIGGSAFSGCESLTGIYVDPKNTNYASDSSGVLFDKKKTTLMQAPGTLAGSYTIPNSVTSIGNYAFSDCCNLTSVTIPDSVTAIGSGAFEDCTNLTSVTIPGRLTCISASTFAGCTSLPSVTIPASVREIKEYAFQRCVGMHQIIFQGKAPRIHELIYTGYGGGGGEPGGTWAETYPAEVFGSVEAIVYYPMGDDSWTDSVRQNYSGKLTWEAYDTTPAKPYKIANVVSGVHVYWKETKGAVKYGLWRSETGKNGTYKWIANPTVPHFTDTTVKSGVTYFYKVTTMDAAGKHSEKSEAIGVTYVGTPDITSRYNKAAGITVGWNKIEGATGYAIYRKSYSGNDAWVRVGTISGNQTFTWQDTSVKNNNGTAYKYTVRALAGSDRKTLSGCRNAGRSMVRLTSRTLSSAVKASATSIKCSWNTSSAVTGYEVRFMVGSTVYKTFTIGNYKTGVKTFTGLKSGQTYKIQVRSYVKIDGMGFYSAWSEAKSVKLP